MEVAFHEAPGTELAQWDSQQGHYFHPFGKIWVWVIPELMLLLLATAPSPGGS